MAKRYKKHPNTNLVDTTSYIHKTTDKKIDIDNRTYKFYDGWKQVILVQPRGSFVVIDSYKYKLQNKTHLGMNREETRNLEKVLNKYKGYNIVIR